MREDALGELPRNAVSGRSSARVDDAPAAEASPNGAFNVVVEREKASGGWANSAN